MNSRMENMPGRVLINSLTSNSRPILIVGIVVLKNELRLITSNRGNQSCLLTFMIRDSSTSSISCNCWGNKEYCSSISGTFSIGDIVEIRNCQIRQLSENENQVKFKPFTSSLFQLVVSEKAGSVDSYSGDPQPFDLLMNIPVKIECKLIKLEEIYKSTEIFNGQHADLLVLFKKIHVPREIKTKTGKVVTKSDIIVCDQTANSFTIQIWDSEWISFVQTWTPLECVQDIKLSFNQFSKKMIGTADSKTIFTVNPDTRDAHILYLFAQSMAAEEVDIRDINLDSIHEVYSVQGIRDKIAQSADPGEEKFLGVVYACLTSLDLDGPNSFISTMCKSCGRILDKTQLKCTNVRCAAGSGTEITTAVQQIDIPITISDHTGTFNQCRLIGSVAESFLGCTVNDLIPMRESQQTALKWKFLLERFKWHFQTVYRRSSQSTSIRILGGTKVDLMEWCSNVCS